MPSSVSKLAARNAANKRWGRKDDDTARQLAEARITDYVSKVVASAPPLTDSQVHRISALLRPAVGGDAA